MYKKIFLYAFLSLFALPPWCEAGQNAVLIGGGKSCQECKVARIAYKRNLDFRTQPGWLEHFITSVEIGGGLWLTSDQTIIHTDITPMLAYIFQKGSEISPYVEGGVGMAYLSDDEFDDREFGTNFSFRDVLGAGIKFGKGRQYLLGLRYTHYSNAGLADENEGMDILMLTCGISF